ncbi:MAG: oligosaccharide flippase family protein [Candidatus Thorarchaeota archaeon]
MSTPEKAVKGTTALVSQSMISGLLRILSIMILAKLLLQAEMGQIALLGVIYGITQFLGALGLNHASPYYLGKNATDDEPSIARSFLNKSTLLILAASTFLAISLLVSLPLIVATGYLSFELVLLAALLIPLSSIDVFLDSFLLGRYRVNSLVASRMIFEGSRFFFSIFLVLLGFGVYGVLLGWLIGEGIGVVVFSFASRFKLSTRKADIRMLPVLGFALPSLAFQTVDVAIQNADRLILLSLTSLVTLGVYDVLLNLLFMLSFFSLSVSTSLYPVLTRLEHTSDNSKQQEHNTEQATTLLVRYIILALLPVSIVLAMHSELVLNILVGATYSSYLNASLSFAILAIAYILWGITYSFHSVLRARGEKKFFIYVGLFVIAFEVAGCWILTSMLGLLGASIIRAIYIGVLFLSALAAVHKQNPFRYRSLIRSIIKITLSATICSVLIFFFPPYDIMSLLLWIGLLAIFYLGLLFLTREISKVDFTLAKMLFPNQIESLIQKLEDMYLKREN